MGKSEFGLYGEVGGMAVIVMLAYEMGSLRISPETAAEPRIRRFAGCRSATVMRAGKHIQ